MEDVGFRVVQFIHTRIKVDAEWSVWENRGFTWWGSKFAQRIWADIPFEREGDEICRIHIQTDFLCGFEGTDDQLIRLAELASLVTTSGFVRPPEEPGKLRLAASLYVHEEIRPWMEELLAWIAPIQANEAEVFCDLFRLLGENIAVPDHSSHPVTGERFTPDDMLNLTDQLVVPAGQSPSKWAGEPLDQLCKYLQGPPCLMASADENALIAEYPFPWLTCALQIWTDRPHPILGNGCLLHLTLPEGGIDARSMKNALALNDAEIFSELTRAYFLGSWCATEGGLTFAAFVPNALYSMTSLISIAINMVLRGRVISQDLHDYDWDANFDKDIKQKIQELQGFLEALERQRIGTSGHNSIS